MLCHARSVGVEDADHLNTHTVQAMVVEEHRLCAPFALVIARPYADGVHVAPVTLRLWMDGRVAIHLTGGCLQDLTLRPACQSQHVIGSEHRGLGSLDRVVLIIDRRGRTGEVIDLVDLCPVRLTHIVPHHLKIRPSYQVPYILLRSGIEVVQTDHVVAFIHQSFTKVGADKACATSHQNTFHHCF